MTARASRDASASPGSWAIWASSPRASGKVSRRDGHHQRAPSQRTPHSLTTRSCTGFPTRPCVPRAVSVFPSRRAPALVSYLNSRQPPERTCASPLPSQKLWPTTRPRVPLLFRIWQAHWHSRLSRKIKVRQIIVTPRLARAQLSSRSVRPERHGLRCHGLL